MTKAIQDLAPTDPPIGWEAAQAAGSALPCRSPLRRCYRLALPQRRELLRQLVQQRQRGVLGAHQRQRRFVVSDLALLDRLLATAHPARIRELVGDEDQCGVVTARAGARAQIGLADLVVGDRLVFGERADERCDTRPESRR